MNAVTPYVHLDKTLAPTPGSAAHNKAVKRKHDNLGQGSEQVDLLPEAAAFFVGQIESDKGYNPQSGGEKEIRGTVAGWTKRMFGLEANADNTSVAQQQGRGLINDFANYIGSQYTGEAWAKEFLEDPKHRTPAILVPRNSWSLTNEIFKIAGFKVIEYDIEDGNISGSFEKAIECYKEDHIIAAAYFNFPHNASGLHLTDEEGRKLQGISDKHNLSGDSEHKMVVLHDVPYFSACPKNDSDGSYLHAGLKYIIDPTIKKAEYVITPTIGILSGSKFLRMARHGLAWEITTPDLTKILRDYHNMSGNGTRYDPVLFSNIEKGLHPENDHIWHKQFDIDRKKFGDNYVELQRVFGDDVLEGGANLVGLFKLKGVFGKAVMCHDGVERYIPKPGETAESQKAARQAYLSYVANGTETEEGIILVDGEVDKNNEPLARIALAKPQEDFKAVVQRLGRINEHIRQSRDVTPAEGMSLGLA